jgi:hypothetical protein
MNPRLPGYVEGMSITRLSRSVLGEPSVYIQSVPGGKVSILGRHSIGHSKQKCIYTCVLFRTVFEIDLFHCTVPKLLIRKICYILFLIPVFIIQVKK